MAAADLLGRCYTGFSTRHNLAITLENHKVGCLMKFVPLKLNVFMRM